MAARPRPHCIDAAPLADRVLERVPQAVADEPQGVEEVALPRAIRADESNESAETDVAGPHASVVAQGNPLNQGGHGPRILGPRWWTRMQDEADQLLRATRATCASSASRTARSRASRRASVTSSCACGRPRA